MANPVPNAVPESVSEITLTTLLLASLTAAGADALAAKPEDILTYLHQH